MLADLERGPADPYRRRTRSSSARNIADDAGQGGPRDAALPADPVYADDRAGAGDAAGDLPAVDQPLLHPRSHAGEELHPLGGRAGADGVHGLVEVGRREHGGRGLGRLCRARRSTRSTRCASGSSVEAVHTIGYCVAGTTLAATLAVLARARRGGQGRERDLLHRAGRFRRRRRARAFRRRRAARDDRARSSPDGYPRRALHGGDLQPAARARPDLELRRQQLPAGRGLSAVRPAPLERRHHQPAGEVAPELSARPLPRQSAGRARARWRSTARRST